MSASVPYRSAFSGKVVATTAGGSGTLPVTAAYRRRSRDSSRAKGLEEEPMRRTYDATTVKIWDTSHEIARRNLNREPPEEEAEAVGLEGHRTLEEETVVAGPDDRRTEDRRTAEEEEATTGHSTGSGARCTTPSPKVNHSTGHLYWKSWNGHQQRQRGRQQRRQRQRRRQRRRTFTLFLLPGSAPPIHIDRPVAPPPPLGQVQQGVVIQGRLHHAG